MGKRCPRRLGPTASPAATAAAPTCAATRSARAGRRTDYLLFNANLFVNELIRKIPAGATDPAAKRVQIEGMVRF
jgi:hypothetical protein